MNASDLRGILQYVPRFRDRIFVICMDGAIVASENFHNILLDIAVLRSLNIKVVLVHGASHQIRQTAAARNLEMPTSDGTGPTSAEGLEVSLDAATRLTNTILQGLTAVDLRAACSNAIIAHPAGILKGVDHQHTGRVERVDAQSLHLFLNEGIIPVIPPLGFDGEGSTFRVNSDAIAVEVGETLHAAKLIFLTPGMLLHVDGEEVYEVSMEEAENILKRPASISPPEVLSKLNHAALACRAGVPRVHLLDGLRDDALLTELFSNEGSGTMIYSNEYQQVRPMFKKDVRRVITLIRQSVDNEELVRRTRAQIVSSIQDYWVLEVDRNIVGCVALIPYRDESMAELACLYVSKSHENEGHGSKLMAFVEKTAAERGFTRLLALSTQAFKFLQQKGGFEEVTSDQLPEQRRLGYEQSGRNSRVLMKTLTPPKAAK